MPSSLTIVRAWRWTALIVSGDITVELTDGTFRHRMPHHNDEAKIIWSNMRPNATLHTMTKPIHDVAELLKLQNELNAYEDGKAAKP